jgi:two-component system phosphate regulon sensor histidine kinase PhoR
MARRRLVWKVTPVFLLIILLCTAAVAWYAGRAVDQFFRDHIVRDLTRTTHIFAPQVAAMIQRDDLAAIADFCEGVGSRGEMRVTVIAPDDRVLGDSQTDPTTMEPHGPHGSRPEITDAMAGKDGVDTRFSRTVRRDMIYVARGLEVDGEVIGVLRMSLWVTEVDGVLGDLHRRIVTGGLLTTAIALVFALFVVSRQISVPLKQLQTGAGRFAAGLLDRPLDVPDTEEIGALAEALNTMARQLDEKLHTISRQSREQQAILSSMIEGVLAVDGDERLITLNEAAAVFLSVENRAVQGRGIYEVVRNSDLQSLISLALESRDPIDGELNVGMGERERSLQAQAARMHDPDGRDGGGVVVVLHDVTRLRQLEMVRQQFVANVSHELKTPITAIKAAVETLIDEAGDRDSAHARFLGIIARQADRLHAIVEDLLTLARLEQEDRRGEARFTLSRLAPVLRGAVETCEAKARQRRIQIDLQADEAVACDVNAPLLEQAVVNLLDNAIKYSGDNTTVRLSLEASAAEWIITVTDQGPGIEPRHLARIFERFYRTDHARSRELGGTGLGLSIVKHVAQTHGGRVSVDSTPAPSPDHGSTFRIHLPRA